MVDVEKLYKEYVEDCKRNGEKIMFSFDELKALVGEYERAVNQYKKKYLSTNTEKEIYEYIEGVIEKLGIQKDDVVDRIEEIYDEVVSNIDVKGLYFGDWYNALSDVSSDMDTPVFVGRFEIVPIEDAPIYDYFGSNILGTTWHEGVKLKDSDDYFMKIYVDIYYDEFDMYRAILNVIRDKFGIEIDRDEYGEGDEMYIVRDVELDCEIY